MIALLVLIAVIAAGLTPLILRDLRRAVERRRLRRRMARFAVNAHQMAAAIQAIGISAAVAADRIRAFGDALRQEAGR